MVPVRSAASVASGRTGLSAAIATAWPYRDEAGRDRHAPTVDLDVTVRDELARLRPRRGQTEAVDHVVETPLEQPEQVVADELAALAGRRVDIAAELALANAVVPLGPLLLTQLLPED